MKLIFSRDPGSSIYIGSCDEACVVTLLKLYPQRRAVAALVNRTSARRPGVLDSRSVEMALDAAVNVGPYAQVSLVELRADRARLSVNAPAETAVHRLEVYEAIRRAGGGRDEGPGNAVVR